MAASGVYYSAGFHSELCIVCCVMCMYSIGHVCVQNYVTVCTYSLCVNVLYVLCVCVCVCVCVCMCVCVCVCVCC